MLFRVLVLLSVLFFISCSSSKKLAEQKQNEPEEKNKTQNSVKKESDSDSELMGLLGNKDSEKSSNEADKTSEKTDADLQKASGVSYESIDGKPLEKADEAKKEVEEKKTPKKIEKREANKQNDDVSKVTVLQKEIQNLKNELNQKNSSISSLQREKNNLLSENTQLKTSKSSQIVYQKAAERISKEDYQAKYDEAYQLFKSKQYDAAIAQFENLIANDASNSLSDNAQYWIGESHFGQRKFKQAILDFEKVFTFKKSNKAEDAQFKIGYCYYVLKDRTNARIELERFINQYPNSRNAARAQKMISSL